MANKTLIVIYGPTASGKTEAAISLALRLNCHIINADSRQIYKDIPIATCAPTLEQLSRVPHHFVGTLPLDAYYSAAQFEADVLALLPTLFQDSDYAILAGGSVMYIDAVTNGLDDIPAISDEVRTKVKKLYDEHGLDGLNAMLEVLDPEYFATVDKANTKRVAHALEICFQAGKPYSELRTGKTKPRPFNIIRTAIIPDRQTLFTRINNRVTEMIDNGLVEEARRVYPLRHLNSLNTVGLKELFAYFDGQMPLDIAIARIAKNTRVYAKKQLTLLARKSDLSEVTEGALLCADF